MPLNTVAMTTTLLKLQPDAKLVAFGAQSTWGVLNDDETIADDGMGEPVTVRTREVYIARDALTGLVDGSAITVGGVAYTVRNRPRPMENGDLWRVAVVRAS